MLALVAVVVGVDVLFFRHRFWERLMMNVGIVLVFAAFYLRFLKQARAPPPLRIRSSTGRRRWCRCLRFAPIVAPSAVSRRP